MGTAGGFGYTAFAPEDVEDAQRGHPSVGLAGYAGARGLEYLDQAQVGAFRGVLPTWPNYIFNAMRGAIPGGWYGLLQHELHEMPIDQDGIRGGGTFYGSRHTYRNPEGALGVITGLSWKEEPNEPFAANAAWAPATRAVVRVSEAALLPDLLVRRADRLSGTDLAPHGLPGFRLDRAGRDLPDELLTAIFSGPAGRALASMPTPHVELRLRAGAASVQRNGYAIAEHELDHLAQVTCAVAAGLREAAGPLLAPRTFAEPLPAPGARGAEVVPWYPRPYDDWADGISRVAQERGMADEDVVAFHQAHPTLPMPGVALGVVHGEIPALGRRGRLVFTQQGGGTVGSVRGCVVLEADPAAPAFPLGGLVVPETDQYVETLGGVTAIWNKTRVWGGFASLELIEATKQTLHHVGL
jgi:hypothetical protein